jgi:RNA-binding protein Tab2/Atab2
MKIWQVDFYRCPVSNEEGQTLWELLICDRPHTFIYEAQCPQSQANSDWLVFQFQKASQGQLPDLIQVFRPQSLNLLTVAGQKLNIKVEPTRRTKALKEELQRRSAQYPAYDRLKVEQAIPQALPENLLGEEWRFATLAAGDLVDFFSDRPIPILEMPEFLLPINLGIASTIPIPGVIIYGARKSMQLALWLQEAKPISLNYIPTAVGESGGLILEAGLSDRWVLATFEDPEVAQAAVLYEQRKSSSKGLHFLLVQPDDSGITHTGLWLLQPD